MSIAHVAFWTSDLEQASAFYRDVFSAEIGPEYRSVRTPGFVSRFVRFTAGPAIELMSLPHLAPSASSNPRVGWGHIAISLGSEHAVEETAKQMEARGMLCSGPRWTGDGYFEAVISDPDGNLIEITV